MSCKGSAGEKTARRHTFQRPRLFRVRQHRADGGCQPFIRQQWQHPWRAVLFGEQGAQHQREECRRKLAHNRRGPRATTQALIRQHRQKRRQRAAVITHASRDTLQRRLTAKKQCAADAGAKLTAQHHQRRIVAFRHHFRDHRIVVPLHAGGGAVLPIAFQTVRRAMGQQKNIPRLRLYNFTIEHQPGAAGENGVPGNMPDRALRMIRLPASGETAM